MGDRDCGGLSNLCTVDQWDFVWLVSRIARGCMEVSDSRTAVYTAVLVVALRGYPTFCRAAGDLVCQPPPPSSMTLGRGSPCPPAAMRTIGAESSATSRRGAGAPVAKDNWALVRVAESARTRRCCLCSAMFRLLTPGPRARRYLNQIIRQFADSCHRVVSGRPVGQHHHGGVIHVWHPDQPEHVVLGVSSSWASNLVVHAMKARALTFASPRSDVGTMECSLLGPTPQSTITTYQSRWRPLGHGCVS